MHPLHDVIDHDLLRFVDELLEKYHLPPADRPELEKFLREVRAESFEDGYDRAHSEGYADGHEENYDEGYRNDGKVLDIGA